jgi:hypothetical protein
VCIRKRVDCLPDVLSIHETLRVDEDDGLAGLESLLWVSARWREKQILRNCATEHALDPDPRKNFLDTKSDMSIDQQEKDQGATLQPDTLKSR